MRKLESFWPSSVTWQILRKGETGCSLKKIIFNVRPNRKAKKENIHRLREIEDVEAYPISSAMFLS